MVPAMNRLNDLIVTFADGVNARLLDFQQHSTYWGLLDGKPTHELNEGILASSTHTEGFVPIHLVRPTERLVFQDFPVPYGVLLLLPGLQCQGLFDARGRWLRVAWFQEFWNPTIDPLVNEEFRSTDFLELSVERGGGW
jgi:hypothetical protein